MQFAFPPGLGRLALGLPILTEVSTLQYDVQQTGRSGCVSVNIGQIAIIQSEVFRQESMELYAPFVQSGLLIDSFQLFLVVTSVQGVVSSRHVAELAKPYAVSHQVLQQVGVQHHHVQQGCRDGKCPQGGEATLLDQR